MFYVYFEVIYVYLVPVGDWLEVDLPQPTANVATSPFRRIAAILIPFNEVFLLVAIYKGHIGAEVTVDNGNRLFCFTGRKATVDSLTGGSGIPPTILSLPRLALIVEYKDRVRPKVAGDGVLHLVNLDFKRLVLSALAVGKTGFNEVKLCHRSSSFQCRVL